MKNLNHGATEDSELYSHPLTGKVIGCAIEVHRHLGPGFLESIYEECLAHELRLANIPFEVQLPIPVRYKGALLQGEYKLDLLVDHMLVVELKALNELIPLHQAQLLTYMKLTSVRLGLLINFNIALLKHGVKKFVL